MLGILDYEMGNLGSVQNAWRFLDVPTRLVTQPSELKGCDGLVFPGQGAFRDCMKQLTAHDLVSPIKDWIQADRPYLGICLGLQALFEASEEAPGVAGLGILPGVVTKFAAKPGLKIPQMGWNRVRQVQSSPLWTGIPDNSHFYFVHSYYAPVGAGIPVAGETEYGVNYSAAVARGNMMAVQFHPEKSQQCGLQLLRNFATQLPGAQKAA